MGYPEKFPDYNYILALCTFQKKSLFFGPRRFEGHDAIIELIIEITLFQLRDLRAFIFDTLDPVNYV